ncbi:Pol protein, partial [Phytophthora palmivora]
MDRGEFPHLTDSQFESVRKMVGIFGGDALRSLAAATPAELVERIEAFDTMDLAVKFEAFDSTESFLVIDMDKYDLILGMPWLEKHEPWVVSINAAKPLGLAGPHSQTELWAEVSLNTSRVDNKAPHSESEAAPARPVEEQCHVFDGVSGRQGKAVDVGLKVGEIAEMVLMKPETSPEDLNSSSVMDEDVLEGFTKQRATRLGSDILKNPEDPLYPLVKEYSDVVSKHPPSQLSPDRGVRNEIELVPGTQYCVTRQWPLPREQCEVIDAFFAEKAKSGMVRESKSPHSTPTFCVR